MEKDNRNKCNIDFDVKLKDHLNTSLDKDNITVSEELITKTLQIINNERNTLNPDESEELGNHQKNISGKTKATVRRLVRTAAVLLVLFICYRALGSNLISNKKSVSMDNATSATESTNMADGASTETYSLAQDSTALNEDSVSAGAASQAEESTDTANQEAKSFNITQKADESSALEDNNANENSSEDTNALITGTFSALYSITADQVTNISITNKNENENTVTTEKAVSIQKFFSIINEYELIDGDKNISDTWNYKVVLTTNDDQLYTVLIGEGIQLNNERNASGSDNYYSIKNVDTLATQIEELYKTSIDNNSN